MSCQFSRRCKRNRRSVVRPPAPRSFSIRYLHVLNSLLERVLNTRFLLDRRRTRRQTREDRRDPRRPPAAVAHPLVRCLRHPPRGTFNILRWRSRLRAASLSFLRLMLYPTNYVSTILSSSPLSTDVDFAVGITHVASD